MRGTALFLVVMLLVPAGAIAQEVTHSFADLNRQWLVHLSEEIRITCDLRGTGDYEWMDVDMVDLTDSAITVEVHYLPPGGAELATPRGDRWRIEIPENRVRKIVRPSHGMRRLTGGLIGAGIGLGVGMAALGACHKGQPNDTCPENEVMLVASIALIGGGAAIGAVLPSPTPEQTLYLSSGSAEASFRYSVVPIVSKKRKGALFTVTW